MRNQGDSLAYVKVSEKVSRAPSFLADIICEQPLESLQAPKHFDQGQKPSIGIRNWPAWRSVPSSIDKCKHH